MPDMVVDGPSDSGSSSNNGPWGGSSGNAGGSVGSNSKGGGISTLNYGESYTTPWGKIVIDSRGHPTMLGVVMTTDNSKMVENPSGGYTRVLNSLLGRPANPMKSDNSKGKVQTAVENYLAGGSWANTGPIDPTLVNTAISDTLASQMKSPRVAISATVTYGYLKDSLNALPFTEQPLARDQINQAMQKAYDALPDRVTTHHETGGASGHTITGTGPNPAKNIMSRFMMPDVKKDLDNTLSKNKSSQIKDMLSSAGDLVADVGEKISDYGEKKFSKIAKDISESISSFQGKTIRNFDDAMKSLNKLLANPGMKVKAADKAAITNALKVVNAKDIASKMGNLAKAFKAADIVQKVTKVINLSIDGYENNNWGPLLLEVESWVLSGMVASAALGAVAMVLSLTTLPVSVVAVATIAGFMLAAILASLIDSEIADALNNALIPSAN